MAFFAEMDMYEAEREYERWVEDDAYNTIICPTYFADLDAANINL